MEPYVCAACKTSWCVQRVNLLTPLRTLASLRAVQGPAAGDVKTVVKCRLDSMPVVCSFGFLTRTLLHAGRVHGVAQSVTDYGVI